jgi:phosphatidylethanolamine-binding protein
MMNDDTYFGQVRHWLAINVSSNSDGALSIAAGSGISPYIPPSPLPNYLYSRPHRYVFIVASDSSNVEVTQDDLRELQKPYVAAMAGNQESQDIKDRWGFNAQQLIEKKGWKIEAATFMRVGGTLKSAAETTSMIAQGMANKV